MAPRNTCRSLGLVLAVGIVAAARGDLHPPDHTPILPIAAGECRMYGVVPEALPPGILAGHLAGDPRSLRFLALLEGHRDGWGLAYYLEPGVLRYIERGVPSAYDDPVYLDIVRRVDGQAPRIAIGHIRNASQGCGGHHQFRVPDPHPFWRRADGRSWVFAHNGDLSKARLRALIGEDYLRVNPPTSSYIPECDPAIPAKWVDSELYFIWVLKSIEENDWDDVRGITAAVEALQAAGELGGMNFLMSDGYTLWAFRWAGMIPAAYPLYYRDDPDGRYFAVASEPPGDESDWSSLGQATLLRVPVSGDVEKWIIGEERRKTGDTRISQ